ncbi:MAG: hypothetical protein AMXMBFR4_30340 [Candidatus Hydrogenedentota bacterium]
MSTSITVALIMRWAHIFSAVIAVGGTIFMRFVLMPAAQATLDDAAHARLRAALIGRWQRFVHTCILLFLVSGFYNYLAITRFEHEGQPIYHMLFGIKFLLALAVFALAIALTSLKPWSEKMRNNSRAWLVVLVALAAAAIVLSGYMRALPKAPAGPAPASAVDED